MGTTASTCRACTSGSVRLGWMSVRAFERIGLELFVEPADGMFVWARFPHIEDSLALAETAKHGGLMLAPGTVFRPHLERSPWMRFNVAVCEVPRVQDLLERLASSTRGVTLASRQRSAIR